jgi:hypothetical protein
MGTVALSRVKRPKCEAGAEGKNTCLHDGQLYCKWAGVIVGEGNVSSLDKVLLCSYRVYFYETQHCWSVLNIMLMFAFVLYYTASKPCKTQNLP